ncbi:hypothetical protein K501DRAFT_195215, partial [Backusella circina FSU 941]
SNTSPMPSTLSMSDRSFIEFTRCLYSAKTIVKELEVFGDTVSPAYSHRQRYDLHISVDEFIGHANQYLDESVHKFTSMCKSMLILLARLEKTQPVKHEYIDSFRDELMFEWKKAELIKWDLLRKIHHKDDHPYHLNKKEYINLSTKAPSTSDNEGDLYTSSSETTPELTSSESS